MIASSENQALVWSQTTGAAYNQMRPTGYAPFLSDAQKARLERIRQSRLLFEGRHEEYFLQEGRTSFDFPPVERNGLTTQMYITANIFGLISLKSGDLLFGQPPLIDCRDPRQFEALHGTEDQEKEGLIRRTQLHAVLLDAAICASAEGEAFLEAIIHTDGQVYIHQLPNEEIFPIGEVQPDGQHAAYLRMQCKNAGTSEQPNWLLLETTIAPGKISRVCRQLDKQFRPGATLEVKQWDKALADVTMTGIRQNTIVWVPNLRGRAISDYDCALKDQDALNAKNTQVSRILQQHADPAMYAIESNAPRDGNVRSNYKMWWVRNKDEAPGYVSWPGDVSAAMEDRRFALMQLLVRTETSPVLLGLKEGAAPEKYKTVRLESNNSLSKAARKSIIWTRATQKIIGVAQALEQTLPGVSYPCYPVGVTLQDGIPVDESDQASDLATLRSAKLISRVRGVKMLLGDEAAVTAEVTELEREDAEAAPSVLFGEPASPSEPGAAVPPTETPPEGGTPTATPAAPDQQIQTTQESVLNGAQITAATAIVTAVSAGEMPRDAGLGQLRVLFNLSPEKVDELMGSAGTKVPTTPNPVQGAAAPAASGGTP